MKGDRKIANLLGRLGRFFVFVGLACGAYMFWHLMVGIILKIALK